MSINEQEDTSYKGNKNLKPQHTAIQFTQEQIQEYIKCENDPIYFMKNYIKIVNVDKGLMLFDMFPFQERIVLNMLEHRNTICCLPRQCGKTTTTAAFAIHQAIFKNNYSILIAANKARTAIEIMKRIREAFQYLPKWLQQGIVKWNEGSVEFENGSRIVGVPTTGDAARGFSYNMIILDEFAFLPRGIADEFFTSVIPTISSGETTKIAILSTPKGQNHFYKIWTETVRSYDDWKEGKIDEKTGEKAGPPGYGHLEIKWNDVPGRDEAFKAKMLKALGGDINRWMQEFECAFIGSSNTLIAPSKLKELTFIRELGKTPDGLTIYKNPEKNRTYFMCVDTSEGKGLDYHAATVVDITEKPFNVVAKYRNNTTPTMILPDIIRHIGNLYNEAFVLIETRSQGPSIVQSLFFDLEYANVLGAQSKGRGGVVLTNFSPQAMGLSTSASTKSQGCSQLKTLVENDQLILNDFEIVEEISNFVLTSSNKWQADDGFHDDLVMTLVMFSWASTTDYFRELTHADIKSIFNDKLREIQEDIVPFGFILDSTDDFGGGPISF